MPDLNGLFKPASIALIGASNNPAKIGGIVLKNLIDSDYLGKIFPINPGETTLSDLKCYPGITDLPEIPDLAIIAIPNTKVLDTLEQIGQKGIKNVLVYTAGFKEAGEEGIALENKLTEISHKYQLNLLGPNCLGFVNNAINLNATFGQVPKTKGNLKIISQSGAIATAFFDWCQVNNLGVDQFITVGNKAIINELDILNYWKESGSSAPIGLYLESITNGPEFIKLTRTISEQHPIFIIKPGKSLEAASAMKSHTGSLAGADDVLQAALRQANLIHCESLSEFFYLSKTLAWENPPKGPKIAIISNAGGPGVIATDAVAQSKLIMANLSPATEKILSNLLPRMAGIHNPIDVLGDALSDRFITALETVLPEDEVDAVLVILTPQLMTQMGKTAQAIGEISKKYQKPIVCSFIGGKQIENGEEILNKYHVPNFDYPEEAIKVLEKIYLWQSQKDSAPSIETSPITLRLDYIQQIINLAKNDTKKLLTPTQADQLLEIAQVNAPANITTDNITIAEEFSLQAGWPVVLKTVQSDLLHKTESHGVITNIQTIAGLRTAWSQMQTLGPLIQIQKQVSEGVELIIGFKRDSVFGDTLIFGLGGKFVNLINDKNIFILPGSKDQFSNLIRSSQAFKLLSGYRGDQPYDISKIALIVSKLAYTFQNTPEITEMEINPLIVTHEAIWAVDTKIILK